MLKSTPIKFSQEEIDYMQPELSKLMRGLNSHEKTKILRKCIIEHFEKKKLNEISN